MINQATPVLEQALADYGQHLGMAFQMVDDMLDYGASSEDIGKNLGDDLAEGKSTLPLLRALQVGDAATQQLLRDAIAQGSAEQWDTVLEAIQSTDALAYTRDRAQQQADLAQQAIQVLPDTPYRDALLAIADFAVTRGV